MTGGEPVSLTIANDLAELGRVRDAVGTFVGTLVEPVERNRIVLAVDEAVTNIIEHGYSPGDRAEIVLRMERRPAALLFIITDTAAPFNPLDVAPPDLDRYHGEGGDGGLGIDAFRRLMKITYEISETGGNRLTLEKPLEP